MKERIISGIGIVAVMLIIVWSGGIVTCLGMGAISIIGYLELTKALKCRKEEKICLLEIIGVVSTVGYYFLLFLTDYKPSFMYLFIYLIGFFGVQMMIYVFNFPRYDSSQVINSFFSFVYCPVMLSFIVVTRALTGDNVDTFFIPGFWAVWDIFILAWGSDTMAYFSGVLLGKHKAFPKLSPKKTVEGCLGGILGAAVFNYLYALILMKNNLITSSETFYFIVLGAIGALLGQIGDLAASAIKRNNDIKDYGNLIPGHGGIMDRFDSIVLISPIVYVVVLNLFSNIIK